MKHKLLIYLTVLALFLSIVPVSGVANGQTQANYQYNPVSGGVAITGVTGSLSGEVLVPEKLGEDTVVCIEERAFAEQSGITGVLLPDTVTSIQYGAFVNCTSLKKVNLPKNLAFLGEEAFGNCTALSEITIPAALKDCAVKWELSDGDTFNGPFYGCSALKTVTFEKEVDTLANCLFAGCNGLESITIPETVTAIGERAFMRCENLKKVIFGDAVASIDYRAFYGVPVTTATLPKNLAFLGEEAFGNCTALSEITIPAALKDCAVKWELSDGDTFNGPFYGCSVLKTVTFEKGIDTIANCLFAGCNGLESIVIPETVTAIGERAFMHCDNLKSVVCADRIQTVGFRAFAFCPNIKTLFLSDCINQMEKECFADSNALCLQVYEGSYAEEYAVNNHIPYEKLPKVQLSLESQSVSSGKDFELTISNLAQGQTVVWSSSNESVAVVKNGVVTGVGEGTAIICANLIYNGNSYMETCEVVVLSSVRGDMDQSGKIDAKDALVVLKIAVGKITPTQQQKSAADANGDGQTNAKDALEILKYAVGKPSALDKVEA